MAERDSHIWTLDITLMDHVLELGHRYANAEISEHDYIDRLRSLGFPQDAKPGDEIKIRFQRKATYGPADQPH